MPDLRNSPLDHIYQFPDLSDAIAHHTNTVYNIFDKHILVDDVLDKNQEKSLWIANEVMEIIGERDASHTNKDIITYLRNKVQYLILKIE